jgi:hypothetical protein
MPNLSYKTHDAIIASWGDDLTLGLLASAPNPDGTGIVEPAAQDGYARQPITLGKTVADGITNLTSVGPLAFGPATNGGWVSVQYFGLFDAEGDLILYGRLRTTRETDAGEGIIVPPDHIQVRLR